MIATSAIGLGACALSRWSVAPTTQTGLADLLKIQTDALKSGNMSGVEEMLFCQAATLQGIFAKVLESAATRDTLHQQQVLLNIAFKAQSQCRATLETLGNIKNPRAATFVKQANIAQNQLVNNGSGEFSDNYPRAHERTLSIEQNELITNPKADHAETMDTRAKGSAGTGDSTLETVGVVHGPRVARRKTSVIP